MRKVVSVALICLSLSVFLLGAIDDAEKRRAASGIQLGYPVVTPNSDQDAQWRSQAAGTYSAFQAGAAGGGIGPFGPIGPRSPIRTP